MTTTIMKCVVFAVAFTSLLSVLEATSRRSLTEASPELQKLCASSEFKDDCVALLPKGMQGKADVDAAVLAGLNILTAETDHAIGEAEKIKKEMPETDKASEELMVGLAVYKVVSESTKKALAAFEAKDEAALLKEVKLANEVTGDLVDIFQENVEGKKEVMQTSNLLIHKLAQINYDIVSTKVKGADSPASAPGAESEEEDEEEEEGKETSEEEEEEEEAEAPAPAPAVAKP